MMVTKAKKVKKAKPKPKPKPSLRRSVFNSMVETLERNVLEGEFDLPSILTRTLDKSDPKFKLGLHREFYIPITGTAPFYRAGEPQLRRLIEFQASYALAAIFEEGIKIKENENLEIPLCSNHQ